MSTFPIDPSGGKSEKLCRFSKRHREFLTSDGTHPGKLPPHLENRVLTFRSVLGQLHTEKQFPAYQVQADGCLTIAKL